ncbi:MAG TPA: Uma2 family endonuclease [Nannocystis sp.]
MPTAADAPSPIPVPIGPSAERWRSMSPDERDRFYAEVFAALNQPAEMMTEGRPHSRAKSAAFDALTLHFKTTGRMIYIADELAVIYPGERVFSPDLLAVLDVPQPDPDEDERMAWVVADEGKGPDMVLEVLYQGRRDKDLIKNVEDYARVGIREYFIYDRLRFRLYGYRLPRLGAAYQELRPRLGRLSSEVLGLDLAVVGKRLRFYHGLAELPNSDEFIERLSKMLEGIEARAREAEAEAQAQARRAEERARQAEAQIRQAVLDLAEAYGLELSDERRRQVAQAGMEELAALRAVLKATRAWP